MFEKQLDDGIARREVCRIQPELGEVLVTAHQLGGFVVDRVEDPLEVGAAQWLLQILDDVELDAPLGEDFDRTARLASTRVVVHQQLEQMRKL